MVAGSHGSTYGGNPLAMAVAGAVLDVITAPGFLEQVRLTGSHFQQHLAMLLAEHPRVVAEVRGEGLLLGLKLHVPAAAFVARAREHGLLVVGSTENVVRLVPPLIVVIAGSTTYAKIAAVSTQTPAIASARAQRSRAPRR